MTGQMSSSYESCEQFIHELCELIGKCVFSPEQHLIMTKLRLLGGMKDKALSRELALDPDVTIETINTLSPIDEYARSMFFIPVLLATMLAQYGD